MKLLDMWDDLVVPEDLVYFRSPASRDRLVANPELASWCLLTEREAEVLSALAGSGRTGAGQQRTSHASTVERVLAKLILKWLVYLPGRKPKVLTPDPQLSMVYYAITDGCNLRCPYCYASSEKCLPGELSTGESLALVDQIADMGVQLLIFTGGEPMLRKDLFEIAEYARARGLTLNIITNGTMIRKPEIARRIADLFQTVTMSMDGGTAELHERTRGKGTFARTSHALQLLNEAGVTPVINHVITEDNVEHLDKMAEFVSAFRVQRVRTMYHSNLGRATTDTFNFGWRHFQKIQEFMWTRPEADKLLPDGPKASKPCSIKGNCGMGGTEIYVDSLGDVYPCKLVTATNQRAGNVRTQRLTEIFDSPLLADLRASSVFEGENLKDCRHCYIRGACGGGCRGYHMAETGDIHHNGRHLCRMLRHSMVTNWWLSVGATRDQLHAFQDEMMRPRLVSNDSTHPVYEDWRTAGRLRLPLVGVS
ncbi:StsB family radical SAM/SPASM domain sactipeptide maturase [Streptomyces sp. NPDC059002]|uniref:StsB family radical SAM/SPASM domain sactipeptide maturase n=1 Tax=Streptomyces sp. NPDC059002 TaxID=3346690 RepID=UPI00367801D8